MRAFFALTAVTFALAGCNGGEDFSDATVGGCPSGAGCTPTSRGEVLVELVGPRVENLGYRCGGTNVVFFTKSTESTSTGSNGDPVTVPAYNALCPSSAQNIEFFIGNGLFEGNYVSLGKILFPKQEALQRYTVTVADFENSPRRQSADLPKTRNIAALIQGLDSDPSDPDTVRIPVEAHDILDDEPELAKSLDTADYDVFRDDWAVGPDVPGIDTYFEKVNDAVAGGIDGLNVDQHIPLAKVKAANRYTRAGNYRFRTCLFITCRDDNDDILSLNLPGRLSNDTPLGEPPLILPNGKIMGLGYAARAASATDAEQELVAFGETAKVDDLLQLQDVSIVSIEDGSTATNLVATGRFLNQLIYNDYNPDNGIGKTDIELNYPTIADSLTDDEKGLLSGDLLSDDVSIPLTAEIEAAPQSEPDQATIDQLAQGTYTLRLMRACLEGANEPTPAACTQIDNLAEEAASDGSGNYFPQINGKDVKEEQPRDDYAQSAAKEICLKVISDEDQPDNGIVMAGPSDGSCPTVLGMDGWAVGFVSRTFLDDNDMPASANLSMLFAPAAPDTTVTSHFGVTVTGRVDLTDSCRPLYRISDPNFDAGIRAAWLDGTDDLTLGLLVGYYPYMQGRAWIDALPPKADGENSLLDLDEDQQEMLLAIRLGAAQFFAGAPGDACDPYPLAP